MSSGAANVVPEIVSATHSPMGPASVSSATTAEASITTSSDGTASVSVPVIDARHLGQPQSRQCRVGFRLSEHAPEPGQRHQRQKDEQPPATAPEAGTPATNDPTWPPVPRVHRVLPPEVG